MAVFMYIHIFTTVDTVVWADLANTPIQTGWEGRRGGLIVVASLVEKAANLGGLCRTCEAFGVRELVVASRAVLQDHTFTSLALTAHRWLPITEVKNVLSLK